MLRGFLLFRPFCCPHTALIVPLLLYVHRVNSVLFVPFTALIVLFFPLNALIVPFLFRSQRKLCPFSSVHRAKCALFRWHPALLKTWAEHCNTRIKCKCKCKCTASDSNANASAIAQQLNQIQMQRHLDQMQMHLDQMQILFYKKKKLRSASDILLKYLVTTINKKTLINNNNEMMGVGFFNWHINTYCKFQPI